MIETEKIKPYPNNVKNHPKSQIESLDKMISLIGFKDPVLLDDTNTILAGHGRILAAKLLGMSEVPAVYAENLSEDQKKAILIMDNLITEKAEWNTQNVVEILNDSTESLIKDELAFEPEEIPGYYFTETAVDVESEIKDTPKSHTIRFNFSFEDEYTNVLTILKEIDPISRENALLKLIEEHENNS